MILQLYSQITKYPPLLIHILVNVKTPRAYSGLIFRTLQNSGFFLFLCD